MLLLAVLMICSSISEVVSLGLVLPFLSALSDIDALFNSSRIQPLLRLLQIETSYQLVTVLAFSFICAVIVANALRIVTLSKQTHLAADIASALSCQIFHRTLLQPYRFHIARNSSDLIQSVTSDTAVLTSALMSILAVITNSLLAVSLVIGLCLIDAQLALISAFFLGSAYTILYHVRRRLLAQNSQIRVQSGQSQIKIVQESLGGIRDVLLTNNQSFFQHEYQQADYSLRHAIAANQVISAAPRYLIEALAMLAIALLALLLGREGDFSTAVPTLGGFALGANRLLPALQQSFAALATLQGARASLERVVAGLQLPIAASISATAYDSLSLQQAITFQRVWFSYQLDAHEHWILQDLSLHISARSTVGFVGSTGSGKSTTVDLILGLLQPQKGQIKIDGHPLEGELVKTWQNSISHVPQSIFLSDATLAENIAFGVPKNLIDYHQVCRSAKLAKIDEFIESLPDQYETTVGERGIRLSGGQRQRVGIARAMYRNASVVIFDEATSALDNVTEQEVMQAIHELSHKLTIILIAHRLSTVERCDVIFELHQGRLVASGTYQELLETSPTFKRLALEELPYQ
ncbi:ABC transporter ATP-binding protein [Leptolyngbya iicbica LK]|uniref:ABC transporter ATP-binding protein n=2 Tax=Cyanophyceae TaxID=3028117 RepID=A0A4Q7EI95_9CYAN|nr:ABC transporter ATP-binding protein [Leptolyngbya sp. LK]